MPRIRCTQKLLKLLGKEAGLAFRKDDSEESDLDWYANLFYVEGRKCLIFTNVGTLASFVALDVLKGDVADLPSFFRSRYRDFLGSLEATADQIEHELESYRNLEVGKSSNRSVLGCMTDFIWQVKNDVDRSGGLGWADPVAIDARMVVCPMGRRLTLPIKALAERLPGIRSMADLPLNLRRSVPYDALQDFIYRSDGLAAWLGRFGLRGFLFSVITCPRMVEPSAWMNVLLEDGRGELTGFDSQDDVYAVHECIVEENNRIAAGIARTGGVLPEDVPFREPVMFNFYPYSPVSQWSAGFRHGFEWLAEVWQASLPPEQFEAAVESGACLAFFANRRQSLRDIVSSGLKESDIEGVAETMRDHFVESSKAVAAYARAGMLGPHPGGDGGVA